MGGLVCPNCGHRISRSQRQSNLFHKLADAYAKVTGYSSEAAKMELKYLFGVKVAWKDIEQGYVPEWSGKPLDAWGELWYVKSESEMTTEEESRLIMGAERAVLEAGGDIEW